MRFGLPEPAQSVAKKKTVHTQKPIPAQARALATLHMVNTFALGTQKTRLHVPRVAMYAHWMEGDGGEGKVGRGIHEPWPDMLAKHSDGMRWFVHMRMCVL